MISIPPPSRPSRPCARPVAAPVGKLAMLLAAMLLWASPAMAEQLVIKQYYRGLPDMSQITTLVGQPDDFAALQQAVQKAVAATRDGQGDIPGLTQFSGATGSKVTAALTQLSPKLPTAQLKLGVVDRAMRSDGVPDLYVMVDYLHQPDGAGSGDRYFYLWHLHWEGSTKDYKGTLFGPSLAGRVLGVFPFAIHKRPTVFIHTVSCTDCRPWENLLAMDFSGDGMLYEFTYAADHKKGWKPTIEYALPGHGQSADVTVETRLPKSGVFHLLQRFVPEPPKGKTQTHANDEWWAFTCLGYRCDYEQWLGEAPGEVSSAWQDAPRL